MNRRALLVLLTSIAAPGCYAAQELGGPDASTDSGAPEDAAIDAGGFECPDGPGRAEVLSSTAPRFRTGGTGVGDERLIFFRNEDGASELFLVRSNGERFEVLDEVEVDTPVSSIQSLADDLAVYTSLSGGGLLELDADRIERRGTYHIGMPTLEAAVSGDRLWICARPNWLETEFFEYNLSDLDAPARIARGETRGCSSVVASSDGRHAYLTEDQAFSDPDVLLLTPNEAGAATTESLGLEAETLHARHGYLTTITHSEVSVHREPDLEWIGSVTGTLSSARVTTRGFEVYGATDARPDEVGLTVYEIDEESSPSLIEISWEPIEADPPEGAARWISHDDSLRSSGRLYVLRSPSPHLHEVDDPEREWPGIAVVEGRDVFLRDATSWVHFDVSDPRSPHVVAGGPHGGADAIALEPNDEKPALYPDMNRRSDELGAVRFGGPVDSPPAQLAVRTFDGDGSAVDAFTHALDLDYGSSTFERLHLAAGFIHQVRYSPEGSTAFRMQRWPIDGVAAGQMETPADFDRGWPEFSDVDVVARVHDARATATAITRDDEAEIRWMSLESDEVATFTLTSQSSSWGIVDLAVHGDRVLAVGANITGTSTSRDGILLSLEHRDGRLEEVDRFEWTAARYAQRRLVLSFDGDVAYVQFANGGMIGDDDHVVVAMRFSDLSGPRGVYRFPYSYPLQSFIETDFGYVASYENRLTILSRWCE